MHHPVANGIVVGARGSFILELSGVSVSYGSRSVLNGLDLTVDRGEIVVLIGANGSGKSTVLRTIAGLAQPSGTVRFEGRDLIGLAPHEVSRLGVGYLLQGGHVFRNLTVRENLQLADGGGLDARRRAYAMFPELEGLGPRRAGLLSGGQRQMLAIGMVSSRAPRLLLLDEPSAGLAPMLVGDMLDRLRELNVREGTAILLVEQNVMMALRIAGRVYRLADGRADPLDAASLRDEGTLLESLGVSRIASGGASPGGTGRAVGTGEGA